ncbi:MAG: Smr/MutS family protein [Clostridiales bacterium]|nr:Smr/MutS family protein [Clostridiales bacterium]
MKDDFGAMLEGYMGGLTDKTKSEPKVVVHTKPKSPIVKELDVHGCTLAQATKKLEEMIVYCIAKRIPKFKLIHGKGNHSPREGVLRQELRKMLDNNSQVKLDICQPKDGGHGAIWVILKL